MGTAGCDKATKLRRLSGQIEQTRWAGDADGRKREPRGRTAVNLPAIVGGEGLWAGEARSIEDERRAVREERGRPEAALVRNFR